MNQPTATNKTTALPAAKTQWSLRSKLILIFISIQIIPSLMVVGLAWRQTSALMFTLRRNTTEMSRQANGALEMVGDVATRDLVYVVDQLVINEMERASTDIAARLAAFLRKIDDDIRVFSVLPPDRDYYQSFITERRRQIVVPGEWVLSADEKKWEPKTSPPPAVEITSSNLENATSFHYRAPDQFAWEGRPLFLEATFVDLDGNEKIKITTSPLMDATLKNVADRENTFVKAETYFAELTQLQKGEIYVSDVIGAYVGSRLIGIYTPENCATRGLEFTPEKEAFAGQENPLGKRFHGLVRWAMPVFRDGKKVGYATLALDHDHIMEFVNHYTPNADHYTEMPIAYDGNYAFMWDYKCRSIAHPRHHSIVGYNPETGEPETPWLESTLYEDMTSKGYDRADWYKYIDDLPDYQPFSADESSRAFQSRKKRPARALTTAGLVGLDGRYLNNAPQCTGWMDLTRDGGSGSFLILWSGVWKPTAVAAIPYYTGNYGKTKRGFGVIAVSSALENIQSAVSDTRLELNKIIAVADRNLGTTARNMSEVIDDSLYEMGFTLLLIFLVMIIIVVLIVVWGVSVLMRRITHISDGFGQYRLGNRYFRFNTPYHDEIGIVEDAFDAMAEILEQAQDEPTTIVDKQHRVVYANAASLAMMKKKPPEVIGKFYTDCSVFPKDQWYNPISALEENREMEILYLSLEDRYVRGKATYLRDADGGVVGYIVTVYEFTEMIRQQQRLEDAMVAANIANEHKGQFLARMSHEIRTPMNAIIGITGIIKRQINSTDCNREQLNNNLDQVMASSQHLLGLLNDVLDISKIESGKVELNPEKTFLLELFKAVVSIVKPRADEHGVKFVSDMELSPDSSGVFMCDSLRLRQVLINLLGNAIKFTPGNGTVTFNVEQKETHNKKALLKFTVQDTGIGISEENLENLFKPFKQAHQGISQKYGGTGLGLAISRSLVQMFGGDIAVKSVENRGSRFSFMIWLEEIKEAPEAEIEIGVVQNKLAGKRALLVDDVAINRVVAASVFDDTGLEIDEAADGTEAVEKFTSSPAGHYDIIYMDIQMPLMNGYDAAKTIRSSDHIDAATVPIIALTANAFKDDIDRAKAHGMNGHLAKPLVLEDVLRLTFKLLKIGVELREEKSVPDAQADSEIAYLDSDNLEAEINNYIASELDPANELESTDLLPIRGVNSPDV